MLKERELLGEGAFSRVSEVVEDSSQRTFALKRMTKTAALQCPEHVYCEQHISKNTTNAFCIRQYASFKVGRCDPGTMTSAPCIHGCAGSVTRPSTTVAHLCWTRMSQQQQCAALPATILHCYFMHRHHHLLPAVLTHWCGLFPAGQAPPVLPV